MPSCRSHKYRYPIGTQGFHREHDSPYPSKHPLHAQDYYPNSCKYARFASSCSRISQSSGHTRTLFSNQPHRQANHWPYIPQGGRCRFSSCGSWNPTEWSRQWHDYDAKWHAEANPLKAYQGQLCLLFQPSAYPFHPLEESQSYSQRFLPSLYPPIRQHRLNPSPRQGWASTFQSQTNPSQNHQVQEKPCRAGRQAKIAQHQTDSLPTQM